MDNHMESKRPGADLVTTMTGSIGGGCYLPKPINTFLDLRDIIFQITLNLFQ